MEITHAEETYISMLSRIRCFGLHHYSVCFCLDDLAKFINSTALKKIEMDCPT